MSDTQLGKPPAADAQRDAIHIAIVPLRARCRFHKGDRFKLSAFDSTTADYANEEDAIGIVDPFLPDWPHVEPGDMFWGLLYQNSVTGMRHHWQHPAFVDVPSHQLIETEITKLEASIKNLDSVIQENLNENILSSFINNIKGLFNINKRTKPTKEESEKWLRDFVKNAHCPDFETVITAVTGGSISYDSYYDSGYRIDEDYLYFGGRDAHGDIPAEFWDHVENYTGKKCEVKAKAFSCSC